MRRHHYTNITPTIENELIFYCDCNNNVIDKVSNIDLFATVQGSSSSWNPLYVTDPSDSTRYCLKKRSGAYRVPCIIGDYRGATGNYYERCYVIAKSQAYSDESARRFLASPTYGDHKVEFYWYCGNSNSVSGSIFDYSGLGNNNANANNSGIALITVGTNVLFRARNNSATSLDTIVGTRSSLKNKWYFVEMLFEYVSTTQYKVTFSVKDETKSTTIVSGYHILTQPLLNTKVERGVFLFLSDNAGSGNWAINEIDYIKEVKVWKINTQLESYINWLKSLGCVFYAPLYQNDLKDYISGEIPTTDTNCTVTWDENKGMYKLYSNRNNGQNVGSLNWRSGLLTNFSNGDACTALITVQENQTSGNGYCAMITIPNLYGINTSNVNLTWICQRRYGNIIDTNLHKYAVTYPQNTGQSPVDVKFYRDGNLITTSNWGMQSSVGQNTVGIGQVNNGSSYYEIYAKDAMIFNRVLSQDEIKQIQNIQ